MRLVLKPGYTHICCRRSRKGHCADELSHTFRCPEDDRNRLDCRQT